jgi:hypothetical protein
MTRDSNVQVALTRVVMAAEVVNMETGEEAMRIEEDMVEEIEEKTLVMVEAVDMAVGVEDLMIEVDMVAVEDMAAIEVVTEVGVAAVATKTAAVTEVAAAVATKTEAVTEVEVDTREVKAVQAAVNEGRTMTQMKSL